MQIPSGMTQQARMLRSAVLEHVPHGFSTREGGVSSGAFATLNFGNPGDLAAEQRDPRRNIEENIRRALAACRAAGRELVEVHQVHGAAVHVVRRGERSHAGPHDTKADAIVTDDPERMIGVRVADCAPVLIASHDGRVAAAVHAGWRGVVAGVAVHAVSAMRELAPGSCAAGLSAAIGPRIGPDAFEVGPEVAAEFARVFGRGTAHVRAGAGDRSLVDLGGALAEQLRGAGVERVDVLARCTYSEPSLFFSHRRATHERAATGRMIAMIGVAEGGAVTERAGALRAVR